MAKQKKFGSKGTTTFVSCSVAETKKIGRAIGERLVSGDVVALVGDLSAGKTTLVKGLVKGLGAPNPEREIVSPTFVLIREYEGRCHVYHMDWYRLGCVTGNDKRQVLDCFAQDAVSLVEWADKARPLLPKNRWEIKLQHAGKEKRSISVRHLE